MPGCPSYPVAEKYGLLFVFLGDLQEDERPAVADIMPEWDSGDWHKDVITREKNVNFIRMCENYNDPCHVHYIHEFAKWLPKGVTIVDHELNDRYLRAWHASHDADGEHSLSAGLMMEYNVISCVSRNTNYQPDYPPQIVTAYTTPVDEHNTRIFMIILMPKGESTAAGREPGARCNRRGTQSHGGHDPRHGYGRRLRGVEKHAPGCCCSNQRGIAGGHRSHAGAGQKNDGRIR